MNNNPTSKKDKIQNILEKIQKNELTLKSKWYFRLRFAALIFVVIAVLVVSVFLSSFIGFSIQASGQSSLLGFGPSGWQVFFHLFPWKLSLLEIVLIVLLEWMLRSFKFGYKVPVLYLLGGVLCFMLVTGFVVDKTPLQTLLLSQADQNHLPQPFGDLYSGVHRPPPRGDGFLRGTITSIATSSLMVALDNPAGMGTTTAAEVLLLPNQSPDQLQVGERIFIEGQIVNGVIQAREIHNANDAPPPGDGDHSPGGDHDGGQDH